MKGYFTRTEKILWLTSIALIVGSFFMYDRENYIAATASIIGASAIVLCAKGNPIGQVLMIIFSAIYVGISVSYRYYGEVMTYLGMTLPMSVLGLVAWLKNPFMGKRTEVTVSNVAKGDIVNMLILSAAVTFISYFALKWLGTANLLISTLSVATSFSAVFLSYKRSPYFALAYAVNDVVLVILWVLASIDDKSYISVVVCFVVFLVNDLYGLYNWERMRKRQEKQTLEYFS